MFPFEAARSDCERKVACISSCCVLFDAGVNDSFYAVRVQGSD